MTPKPTARTETGDRLTEALAALPRPTASAGFTGRVLARLDRPATGRRRPLVAALAATVAALAVAVAVHLAPSPRPPEPRAAAVAELRAEYERLEAELQGLRRLADEASLLHLASTEEIDLVLDLRPLATARRPAALPASRERRDGAPARHDG